MRDSLTKHASASAPSRSALGLTACCATAVAVAVIAIRRARMRWRLRHIPVMSGHVPLLGRMETLKDAQHGKLIRTWAAGAAEADRAGAPMMRPSIGGKPFMVLLVDPAAIHAVLKRPMYVPKWVEGYQFFHWLGWRSNSLIDATSEEQHVHERKAFNAFFSQENIAAVLEKLVQQVALKCDEVARDATKHADGAVTLDIAGAANEIIAAIVKQVFFQSKVDVDLQAFADQVEVMGELLFHPLENKLMAWRLHPTYWRRYRSNVRKLRASWEAIALEAYTRPMEDDNTAFWACVRRAYPEARTDKAQWERAVTSISLIYLAGSETTANAIGVLLAALATDTGTCQKLEAELQEAGLLATPEQPPPRAPTKEDFDSLRYLNAIFHEGMRFFPTAPNGSFRMLQKDLDTGKGVIPAGTIVGITPWGIHRSTQVWGEDAGQWRPERWLEGRSILAVKKDKQGALRWLPFSDGRQNCIGQHIATLEAKLALAMFVGRFRLRMAPHMAFQSVAELADSCTSLVTLHQKGGFWLTLQPRATATSSMA